MTDTRLLVDLGDLGATVRLLTGLEQRLDHATARTTRSAGGAGDVGAALRDFARHWEHGLSDLHDTVHELRVALSVANDAYTAHERELGERFGPAGGSAP